VAAGRAALELSPYGAARSGGFDLSTRAGSAHSDPAADHALARLTNVIWNVDPPGGKWGRSLICLRPGEAIKYRDFGRGVEAVW